VAQLRWCYIKLYWRMDLLHVPLFCLVYCLRYKYISLYIYIFFLFTPCVKRNNNCIYCPIYFLCFYNVNRKDLIITQTFIFCSLLFTFYFIVIFIYRNFLFCSLILFPFFCSFFSNCYQIFLCT